VKTTGYLHTNELQYLLSCKDSLQEINKKLNDLKKSEPLSSNKDINPYVYTNRLDEINNISYFFDDASQKLLLVGGIQGAGKSSLVRSVLVTCDPQVLVYWYECSKITNLDDLLLSLCAFFDKKLSKSLFPPKNRNIISIDERLISYLKSLNRPIIIVIDSIEHLVSPSLNIADEELKYFFNFLLEHPFVKLVLMGQRLPTADMEYNEEFITELRTGGLSEDKAIKLLRAYDIQSSNTILSEIYKLSRGYPWILLLSAALMKRLNMPPDKIIQEMNLYEDSFETYLLKESYKSLPALEVDLLNYLSVIRHPINIPALSILDKTFEDPVESLKALYNTRLIQTVGKRYYVNNTVRKNIYNLIPLEQKCTLHNTISKFYSAEISKKLADRSIRLSRKLLHSEQYFHNVTATQIYTEKGKFDKKISQPKHYLPHMGKEPLEKTVIKDVDPKYVHAYEQMKQYSVENIHNPQIQKVIQQQNTQPPPNEVDDKMEHRTGHSKQKPKPVETPAKEIMDIDGLEIELTSEEMQLLEDDSIQESNDTVKFSHLKPSVNEETQETEEEAGLDLDLDFDFVSSGTEPASDLDLVESLRFVARSYAAENKHKMAIERYNEAIAICEKLNNSLEYAKTLVPLAECYMQIKQYDKALAKFEKAKNIFVKAGDQTQIPLIMANLGTVYTECYQHEKALGQYNEVFKLPEEVLTNNVKAKVYLGMGEIYDYWQRLRDALKCYNLSLRAFEEINDSLNQAILYSRIALIYDDLGDYPLAVKHYQKSIDLDRQLGRKQTYAANLSNLASVYDEMGDKQKALTHYKQSLLIDKELNQMEGLYKTLSRIGTIYIEMGEIEKALSAYQKELKVARKVNDPYWIAMAYLDMGDLYYFTKEFPRAAKCFLISQKVISKSISTDSKEKIDRRIARIQDHIPRERYERIKNSVQKK
jgi:tetratricopeptide (TPR) repeat protein